jgi:hypothetical protein
MADMTLEQKAEAFDAIVSARKSHIDAVAVYNDRLAFIRSERERGNLRLNVDAEYRAMCDAQRHYFGVTEGLADTALNSENAE